MQKSYRGLDTMNTYACVFILSKYTFVVQLDHINTQPNPEFLAPFKRIDKMSVYYKLLQKFQYSPQRIVITKLIQ